jgi:methylenetetrahydrofolate reductase (NADPH)
MPAPEFCSVTYGAAAPQEGTFTTVREILAEGVSAASHFSCIGATRQSVREQLACSRPWACGGWWLARRPAQRLWRGRRVPVRQRPGGLHPRRDGRDFHIEVAAYPEVHPQPVRPRLTSRPMRPRCVRADAAITQYFYNSDAYFRFVEDTYKLGADMPVVPASCPSALRS